MSLPRSDYKTTVTTHRLRKWTYGYWREGWQGEVSSVQFSHSVMSNSLWPHGLQHARPPCPSPPPRVYSDSCPLSWWCHLTGHLILCHPLLLLPSIFPSIRVFSNESALCISWPKYWRFSISPSNEYLGLISSRTDWLDLLAVQGTLKSHHCLNAIVKVVFFKV